MRKSFKSAVGGFLASLFETILPSAAEGIRRDAAGEVIRRNPEILRPQENKNVSVSNRYDI